VELTSLISCSISGSTDCLSEEDSSSEALSSSLEDDGCGDLSLVELSNFESPCLNALFASPVGALDFRERARLFVKLVGGVTEVPT